jgi:D-alanine-D-alanine ligase
MSAATPKQRLAVIFGGRSSEHGVSCLTAREVLAVIDRDRFDVTAIGITKDGQWVHQSAIWSDLEPGVLPSVDLDAPAFDWSELSGFDVVFPLLHGPWGEDGTVQGLLEMAGVRYVGAGVLASAVGMDKPFTKTVFSAAGLPQLPYVTVQPWEWEADPARALSRIRALGLPVFVKPARAGSSSGVTRVSSWEDLEAAVRTARSFDPKVVVEASAQNAREVECAVMQDEKGMPVASVVGEIVVDAPHVHEYYDFDAKYIDGTSRNVVPTQIPESIRDRIRVYAVQAFDAIGAEGLARVDFFITDNVAGGLVINEINTMPGFTPFSMFPKLWEASGVAYGELVSRLIDLALARPAGLR